MSKESDDLAAFKNEFLKGFGFENSEQTQTPDWQRNIQTYLDDSFERLAERKEEEKEVTLSEEEIKTARKFIENSGVVFSDEHVKKLKEFTREPSIYEIISSVANSYDNDIAYALRGIEPYKHLPKYLLEHSRYEEGFEKWQEIGVDENIRKFFILPEGSKLLDVGCGRSVLKSEHYNWATYTAIDISKNTVKLIEAYFEHEGIEASVVRTSAESMPFEKESFSAVICLGVLGYYPFSYGQAIIKELSRVLIKNRCLVLDIPNTSHEDISLLREVEEYMERPILLKAQEREIEETFKHYFTIKKIDDKSVMKRYYLMKD